MKITLFAARTPKDCFLYCARMRPSRSTWKNQQSWRHDEVAWPAQVIRTMTLVLVIPRSIYNRKSNLQHPKWLFQDRSITGKKPISRTRKVHGKCIRLKQWHSDESQEHHAEISRKWAPYRLPLNIIWSIQFRISAISATRARPHNTSKVHWKQSEHVYSSNQTRMHQPRSSSTTTCNCNYNLLRCARPSQHTSGW